MVYFNYSDTTKPLTVPNINPYHADRAIKWLKDRSLPAYYRPNSNELCAFEFKQGREYTYDALYEALKETKYNWY